MVLYILAGSSKLRIFNFAGTKAYWRDDKAKDPLFTWVKDEALRRPTYKSFIALLDNYETSTGKQEEVTPEEIRENWTFINNICDTKVCIKRDINYA